MRKTIYFMEQPVEVVLAKADEPVRICNATMSIPALLRGCVKELESKENTDFRRFVVMFNADQEIDANVIVHEVFHLYMCLLGYLSDPAETFTCYELSKEIYAYTFDDLFCDVHNAVVSMLEKLKKNEKEGEDEHRQDK